MWSIVNPNDLFFYLLPLLQFSNTPSLHLSYLLLHLQSRQNLPSREGYVNRKAMLSMRRSGVQPALSLADRLYFMTKGKVVYSDTRHNLEGKQDILVRYLGVEV